MGFLLQRQKLPAENGETDFPGLIQREKNDI